MLLFENKGTLDMRAIKVLGMSSKDKTRSTIGFFGTGLKYAIAVLLRTGHEIFIHDGAGNQYRFATVNQQFRDDRFDIVTMNGEELGFTTQLGKQWEVWKAFRELYCNATDEGGSAYDIFDDTYNAEDRGIVRIMVSGKEIEEVWKDRYKYILEPGRRWLFDEMGVEVYEKNHSGDRGLIFYRGVRVSVTDYPALYDFNFREPMKLTEDRTLANSWQVSQYLSIALIVSSHKAFIETLMRPQGESPFEINLPFTFAHMDPGDVFLDTIGELREKYKDVGINLNAIALHRKHREKSMLPTKSIKLNAVEEKQLSRAKKFCHDALGIDIDEFPLIICKDLGGNNQLGRADMEQNIMYLSRKCFNLGTKFVAFGLIEEHTHLKHRVHDETLEQKQVYLEMIVGLGELALGEPI